MRLPCLQLAGVPHVLDAFRELRAGDTCAERQWLCELSALALLHCQDEFGRIVALPLCRSREKTGHPAGLFIGTRLPCTDEPHKPYRTVNLSLDELGAVLRYVSPAITEVPLLHHYSPFPISKSLQPDSQLPGLPLWTGAFESLYHWEKSSLASLLTASHPSVSQGSLFLLCRLYPRSAISP